MINWESTSSSQISRKYLLKLTSDPQSLRQVGVEVDPEDLLPPWALGFDVGKRGGEVTNFVGR